MGTIAPVSRPDNGGESLYPFGVAWSFRSRASFALLAIALVAVALVSADRVGAQTGNGDVDCSSSLTGNDAQVILQGLVDLRTIETTCPIIDARISINSALADFNEDGTVDVADALLLAKCCGTAPGSRFKTLPPGSVLPSSSTCAGLVRPTAENIPENVLWNTRFGTTVTGTTYLSDEINGLPLEARIDGNFTGTTDEIIQWAACKWGFDENHVRAQAQIESSWFAGKLGDCGFVTVPETLGCASVGLLQIRGAELNPVHPGTMPWAWDSTAFNLDYALAVHRACFEGLEIWLDGVSPNNVPYATGDLLGCSGRWFSGDWYSTAAITYMTSLEDILDNRRWYNDATGCINWQTNNWCS